MELRHLRYLLAVVEHQNFTRAAEALHVSQPTLSQQIRQLESVLGVAMLDRSGRRVRTTDAGAEFVEYARRALRDLEAGRRAVHDVQDLSRGSLKLAITPTFTPYLVGPLVDRFITGHPGIALSVEEMTQDHIETALRADELDVGIAFDDVRSAEIDRRTLLVEKLGLIVGHRHPLAGGRGPVTVEQLATEPLALLRPAFATRTHIDRYFRDHDIEPRVVVDANSIGAIIEIVRGGSVATVLPDATARRHPGLASRVISPEMPARTAVLLHRKGGHRSAASRAFTALASGMASGMASGLATGTVTAMDVAAVDR